MELGIAENNLFLNLASLGLAHDLFGARLLPVGTLYDPFINRGLDALNYALYQDARFMVVATPSGVTLAPEGGAHQSISTPLIGLGQPGLASFEPAYVDELAAIMRWGFEHMQADDGGSVYLRLSTRAIDQPERTLTDRQTADLLAGAYWEIEPAEGADLVLVYSGAVVPEVRQAHAELAEDVPGLGILAVTSNERLYHDWQRRLRGRNGGGASTSTGTSHVERLLGRLSPRAALVTVQDGHPAALSWIGSATGRRLYPLGVASFGQSGDLLDLYAHYGLDAAAIVDMAATACLEAARG
jgi:pyruvate dehydrogenase E1 component